MRLYPRTGRIPAIDDDQHGHFEPGEDGGFDLPGELAERLHAVHVRKQPLFEYDIERDARLHGEETDRRRDPQSLYNAVAELVGLAKQAGAAQASEPAQASDPPKAEPAKAAPAAKTASATK